MIERFGLEPNISLQGRLVVVCGFARSGRAAAERLATLGARVRVLDREDSPEIEEAARALGVDLVAGREDPADLGDADLVVASPGVRPSSPWWKTATAQGIPWWSEIELAWRTGVRPLVAITGTNGKTTTTAMLTSCLQTAGIPARAAGNIGTPLVSVRPGDPVVAEVSSFQLAASEAFTAPVAVLLNLAPDHLDWHGDLASYYGAKASLFARLDREATAIVYTSCVAAIDTPARLTTFAIDDATARIEAGALVVADTHICAVDDLRRTQTPFLLDALAAAAAAMALGVSTTAIAQALREFEPEPHRLEVVATIGGVTYVNDSKATDPHAAEAGLASFERPVVLLAGGMNKGLDLSGLARTTATIRAVVAFGDAADEVATAFADGDVPVRHAESVEDAAVVAASLASDGDVVLLSPACSSFDRFRNYEERGDAFRRAVLAFDKENR